MLLAFFTEKVLAKIHFLPYKMILSFFIEKVLAKLFFEKRVSKNIDFYKKDF